MAFITLAISTTLAWGQGPDWRRIGPSTLELNLASVASGPVDRVWFSPSGSTLYARTRSGRTLQTADFETWTAVTEAVASPSPTLVTPVRSPEPGSTVVAAADGLLFALNRNVYRSSDGGRAWECLTAFKSQPLIGPGQRSVAVSPRNRDHLVVGNDFGVWQSVDGGMTWSGLNDVLPNLPIRRILSVPAASQRARIHVENVDAVLEFAPGSASWTRERLESIDREEAERIRLTGSLGAQILSVAHADQTVYAGSADGRIWYATDGGFVFTQASLPPGVNGPVERIWVDPAQPRAAIAALGGNGSNVLRTFNGGQFWDVMDGDLPEAPAHSVTADLASGAVYVATGRGVYWANIDLIGASAPPSWTNLSAGLPAQAAYDIRLDPSGVRLFVAVDGYGLFAAPAPHRRRSLRLINAADFSTRPAAPGSLLSVVGARVNSARGENLEYPVLGVPSETESQIQVPFGAIGPSVALDLVTSEGNALVQLQLQPVSPAIFIGPDGAPMMADADTGELIDARTPARSGGRIQVFATGLGRVRPEFAAGTPTPLQDPPAVVARVEAMIDGQQARVLNATLAPGYTGLYLVEIQLPAVANFGASQVYLSVDGKESNRVQFVIEP